MFVTGLSICVALLLIEGLARGLSYYQRSYRRPDLMARLIARHPESARISAALDAYRVKCGGAPFLYEDYYIFRRVPCETPDVAFTSYFSSRRSPDAAPIAAGTPLVWLFGGSTMLDFSGPDDLTIANALALSMRRAGLPVSIANLGEGAFQSTLELIKFQALLRATDRPPDHAVFYDGYNDAYFGFSYGAGRPQGNLSKHFGAVVSGQHAALSAYILSETLAGYSTAWREFVKPRLGNIVYGDAVFDGSDRNLAATLSAYAANMRQTRATCREYHIDCLFVLQPVLASKQGRTAFEQEAAGRLDARAVDFMGRFMTAARQWPAAPDFVDLSGVLDHDGLDDFVDYGHVGPATSVRIGETLAGILGPRVAARLNAR